GAAARARRRRGVCTSCDSFRFFGCARRDGERVDRVLDQLAERLVDHAVARHDALACEARRHDGDVPVRLALGARAGVPGVLRALVDHLEAERLERGQALADARGHAHGLSSMYFASSSDCAAAKSSMRPMPPNTLKFTQRSVEKLYAT